MELPATDQEMTIERSFNFYSAASEAIVREAFTATVTHGIPYDLELEVVTARGNRIWVREVCRATIRRGRLISLIGVLQDITERRWLEDARRVGERVSASARVATQVAQLKPAVLSMVSLLDQLGSDATLSVQARGYAELARLELVRFDALMKHMSHLSGAA